MALLRVTTIYYSSIQFLLAQESFVSRRNLNVLVLTVTNLMFFLLLGLAVE